MPSNTQVSPTVRAAAPAEIPRTRFLFGRFPKQPPPDAEFLVAIRHAPVERIVAALAWWREMGSLRFLVAHPPGLGEAEAAEALVPILETHPAAAGMEISHGRFLADADELATWLHKRGYVPKHAERVFEAPATAVYERVREMLERFQAEIPPAWRTESIARHSPDLVWPLLAPYQLTDLPSLRKDWHEPGELGYEPEFSNVLLDGDEPIGALLVRANRVCLAVEIRVVKPLRPRLRALANLALFQHIARTTTPANSTIRTLAFRAREQDHGETANLALRMSGRQVAARHIHIRPAAP